MTTFLTTIIGMVQADQPDLTARQLAVLGLITEEKDTAFTVRELAARLNISKPAITRAVDKLESELEYAKRRRDPSDRRSVFIDTTVAGRKYWTKRVVSTAL